MRSVYAKVLISSFGVLAFSYLLFLVSQGQTFPEAFKTEQPLPACWMFKRMRLKEPTSRVAQEVSQAI